ncbi:MAG: RsmD family RNA methyltransferase [Sandaracinaceae bacterium]|jgi:16S rRNA (guanine966-N2)-methyltransferase|nr:RsmD family RNA methyltransferase [Sandaracinaceae bacterium]
MRIIAGALSGRRFEGPPGDSTRPTAERVREGLFSALDARGLCENAVVLDLFAGTGALAFEALSRGAARATCVEKNARVARAISESAKELGLSDRVKVVTVDLLPLRQAAIARLAPLTEDPATLVFLDPPYAEIEKIPALIDAFFAAKLIATSATLVVEHASRSPVAVHEPLASFASYRYGDTGLTLMCLPTEQRE